MTAGAVLCGGASRRMGTDKAMVEVDGVAMAERVARSLAAAGCTPVAFVGGDGPLLATFGRPTIPDDEPGAGPVAAIATALRALADDVLVAACDLPWLDAATVSTVLAAATADADDGDHDGDGPSLVVAETDRLQPLLSWWRSDTLGDVEALRRAGCTAVHEIVTRLGARRVTVPAAAMRNVNRSTDLGERPDARCEPDSLP